MKSLLGLIVVAVINIANGQFLFPDQLPQEQPELETRYQQQNSFGPCRVVGNQIGQCVMLNNCPQFADFPNRRLTNNDIRMLRQFNCGYDNGAPLVCCVGQRPARPQRPQPTRRPPPAPAPPRRPTNVQVRSDLLPAPGVCGGGITDRIIGGNSTRLGEYPYMALLEYAKPGNAKGYHCGGVLINKRYVLTASHCVNGKSIPSSWRLASVRLGEWDLNADIDCNEDGDCSERPKDVAIAELIPHEGYIPASTHQANDIALLRLAEEVQYTPWIKPICLPHDESLRNIDFVGYSMDVVGWGRTETARQSNIKLKATIDVVGFNKCNQAYVQRNVVLRDSQLCAGGQEGIDSCSGDSGGPLIGSAFTAARRPYFFCAGIVSMGPSPCAQKDFPGVYTRVSSYLDWIDSKLRP